MRDILIRGALRRGFRSDRKIKIVRILSQTRAKVDLSSKLTPLNTGNAQLDTQVPSHIGLQTTPKDLSIKGSSGRQFPKWDLAGISTNETISTGHTQSASGRATGSNFSTWSSRKPYRSRENASPAVPLSPGQEARRLLLHKLKLQYSPKFAKKQKVAERSQNIGFERVFHGPKLHRRYYRGNPDYLIVHEPYRSAAAHRERREIENQAANKRLVLGSGAVLYGPRANHPRPLNGYRKMRSYIQFITTPTADTPGTTLMLHFDNKRYLIGNISEGTQRACVQRKIGLAKVEDIFLTGKVDWRSTGGIMGMILTLADVIGTQQATLEANEKAKDKKRDKSIVASQGPRKLRLHGSRNLTHLLATARRFIFRKGMPIELDEIRDENVPQITEDGTIKPTWTDQNIRVWAMPISPDSTSKTTRKRSHEEMSDANTSADVLLSNVTSESAEEMNEREDQIRKGVVAQMFDSDWQLDALTTTKLADVKLPATVFVRNARGKIEKYNGPLPGAGEVVPDIDVLVRKPWPGALIESLPPTKPSRAVVCYIIKNHAQRGKFNPSEATRLGVKKGVAYAQLTSGHSVTTEEGNLVTPEMVMAQGKEGGGLAVVEVPDISYIEPILARPEWALKEVMDGVGAIVWICGEGVVGNEKLQHFIVNNGLENIISSSDCCPNMIALESPATAAIRLHLLDSIRFPVPVHNNTPTSTVQFSGIKARAGSLINLEPTFNLDDKNVIDFLDTNKVIKEAKKEILQLAAEARQRIEDPAYLAKLDEQQSDIPSIDAEIITLGTGSALPSKYRNVSATLLRVPGSGNYLFDCGENTLGQLKRVFGAELPEILKDLKVIWISHLHADHHLGTAAVIKAWHEVTSTDTESSFRRLMVASDEGMLKWLEEYSSVEDYGYSRLDPLYLGPVNNLNRNFDASRTSQYGLTSIQACYVSHCHHALAVAFTFPNGFKVAYSGDCRPSEDFARIGQGATLLIHEATFDDELQGDAIAKKHSTTSEALSIGKKMGARRILLTHFSQRYQKIPVMDDTDGKDQVAIVAFDYMKCKLGDFAKLVEFRPALLKLYEEKEDA